MSQTTADCGYASPVPPSCIPSPTPPAALPPTTVVTVPSTTTTTIDHGLPVTGGDVASLAFTGSLVLVLGAVITIATRRRSA